VRLISGDVRVSFPVSKVDFTSILMGVAVKATTPALVVKKVLKSEYAMVSESAFVEFNVMVDPPEGVINNV
jgi:hypothetical protein